MFVAIILTKPSRTTFYRNTLEKRQHWYGKQSLCLAIFCIAYAVIQSSCL